MDPLQTKDPTCNHSNKRGRPRTEDVIYFTPQPKSLIISELVNKTNSQEVTVNKHEALVATNLDDSDSFAECVADQQYIRNERSKRKNKMVHRKVLTQSVQYTCDYPGCSYGCKLSCNLIKHKRVHTSEKPYLCDQCTFRSNFVNSLKAHKRTHTNDRPYMCKQCSYKCNSSSNLKKHCMHRHPEVPKT